MDVDCGGVGVVEETSQHAVEFGSCDDRGIDHHRVAVERPYRELPSCELVRQCREVVGRVAGPLVQEDRAPRAVRAVRGEWVMSDEEDHFVDLGISEASATWVSGLGVCREAISAGSSKSSRYFGINGFESVVREHVDDRMT